MMVIILMMCCLSKVRTWHPCLLFQLIVFYLSVRFQKRGPIRTLAECPYPGGITGELVNTVSLRKAISNGWLWGKGELVFLKGMIPGSGPHCGGWPHTHECIGGINETPVGYLQIGE